MDEEEPTAEADAPPAFARNVTETYSNRRYSSSTVPNLREQNNSLLDASLDFMHQSTRRSTGYDDEIPLVNSTRKTFGLAFSRNSVLSKTLVHPKSKVAIYKWNLQFLGDPCTL